MIGRDENYRMKGHMQSEKLVHEFEDGSTLTVVLEGFFTPPGTEFI